MRRPPHRRHRHFPKGRWLLARGIHRRVVSFLLFAVLMGALGGWALHVVFESAGIGRGICVIASLLLATWPLAWVATFRIARPVSELARVASQLRDGQLSVRDELRVGPSEQPGEVAEVADALHGMADRVATQLSHQRALMGAVSHELRSPLARVRILVELAREGRASEELYDDLQREVDGMDALVGDLLAGARVDFEALAPVPLDAQTVAERALQIAELPTSLLAMDRPISLVADATLLARALSGLLDNAERYGGGAVRLEVVADENTVRFSVHDSGTGLLEGEAEQMFQPFWRRPPTAEAPPSPPGTGLGLALVRQIAEAHGGAAGAHSREQGGATVWMELPV